jgi:hypothetical protein
MLKQDFDAGRTYSEFLASVQENHDLWHAFSSRARAPEDLVARALSVPGTWYLLVLLEDWCGDAVNSVPHIAALVESAPNLDLRVLEREANPELMDAHLTAGSRSIPVVILLDAEHREVAWWGPRPAPLQGWVRGPGMTLSKEDRYREVRRWYARDRGRTTLEEIVRALEANSAVGCAA